MSKEIILIADDEKNTRNSLSKILSQEEYNVIQAENADEIMKLLKEESVNLIITDLRMPGTDGLSVFHRIKKDYPDIDVIIMTAFGTVESAVEAMKEGVCDYLTKPINIEELIILTRKILQNQKLRQENRYLRERLEDKNQLTKMIYQCERMKDIYNMAQQVALTKSTVLLQGESGTGKEILANVIHSQSVREYQPYIKVSCTAIPEGVLESELFGHEKGAFTGAIERRKGRFELADNGTIFLDEIGEMSLNLQSKFLRILEEKEFQRVGGEKTIKIDVRVISATNKDLRKLVLDGKFREDLFYRLNVVNIIIPPLRERKEDLPLLIQHFIQILSHEINREIEGISPEVMEIFYNYDWPGNIRELKNCIESAIVRSNKSIIEVDNLPTYLKQEKIITSFNPEQQKPISLDEVEKKTILHTLKFVNGNKTKAALILGIGLKTLYRKLEKYGIEG